MYWETMIMNVKYNKKNKRKTRHQKQVSHLFKKRIVFKIMININLDITSGGYLPFTTTRLLPSRDSRQHWRRRVHLLSRLLSCSRMVMKL